MLRHDENRPADIQRAHLLMAGKSPTGGVPDNIHLYDEDSLCKAANPRLSRYVNSSATIRRNLAKYELWTSTGSFDSPEHMEHRAGQQLEVLPGRGTTVRLGAAASTELGSGDMLNVLIILDEWISGIPRG